MILDDRLTPPSQLLVEMDLANFLPKCASKLDPPDLNLPGSKDYRCKSLAPSNAHKF
jgi:hypothetical protein